MDWRGVGSNPAGDIYFHFEFFAPSPFRTGQRSRCKWNQACPFTWSHSCFRPQIWFIMQGLVYKYLQYSFKIHTDLRVVTRGSVEIFARPVKMLYPLEHPQDLSWVHGQVGIALDYSLDQRPQQLGCSVWEEERSKVPSTIKCVPLLVVACAPSFFTLHSAKLTITCTSVERRAVSPRHFIWQRKGRDLTQSHDKSPYTHKNIQKGTWRHKNATETSITQQLRTDFGRSVGVTTAIPLVWLNRVTST